MWIVNLFGIEHPVIVIVFRLVFDKFYCVFLISFKYPFNNFKVFG